MGLFSSICALFSSSGVSNSPSIDDSASTFAETDDYGINPSTGLPMISNSLDAGGNLFCEPSSTLDSSSSSSTLFDDSSSCSTSFDDSSSCGSPFHREIGSSFDSSSSMFESVSSSSTFDD